MRMSNMYTACADANSNANHDPTTNPDPTLTRSLTLSINLTLTLPIVGYDCTHHVQAGFLKRGYGMNAVLLINAINARLLRTCVKRRPVSWWVWPLVLSSYIDQP